MAILVHRLQPSRTEGPPIMKTMNDRKTVTPTPAGRPPGAWAAGWIWALSLGLPAPLSTYAQAPIKSGYDGYVGGLLGFSSASDNVGTGIGFGVQAGYFAFENFGLGAYLRAANHSGDPAPSTFILTAEGLYRFVDILPGLHLGLELGSAKLSTPGASDTSFAWGGKAAYDLTLSEEYPVTVGVDLNLVFSEIGTETLSIFTPMVSAKYWF